MDNKFKEMLKNLNIELNDEMCDYLEYFHNARFFDKIEYLKELKNLTSNKQLTIAAIKLGDINVTHLPKKIQGDLDYSYAEIEAYHYGNKKRLNNLLESLPDVAFLDDDLVKAIKKELSNKAYARFNPKKLKNNVDLVAIIESELRHVEEKIDKRVMNAKYKKELKEIEDYFEQL